MIKVEDLKTAYDELLKADNEQFEAEEARIEAANAREKAFVEAMDEAISDGITDQMRIQKKAEKATRTQLAALQAAEKGSRIAQHVYRQAGIKVDSLNRQMEAKKLVMQRV